MTVAETPSQRRFGALLSFLFCRLAFRQAKRGGGDLTWNLSQAWHAHRLPHASKSISSKVLLWKRTHLGCVFTADGDYIRWGRFYPAAALLVIRSFYIGRYEVGTDANQKLWSNLWRDSKKKEGGYSCVFKQQSPNKCCDSNINSDFWFQGNVQSSQIRQMLHWGESAFLRGFLVRPPRFLHGAISSDPALTAHKHLPSGLFEWKLFLLFFFLFFLRRSGGTILSTIYSITFVLAAPLPVCLCAPPPPPTPPAFISCHLNLICTRPSESSGRFF